MTTSGSDISDVRARAFATADELVGKLRVSGAYREPPFPIEGAAEALGVAKIVRTSIPYSGRLVRVGTRFVVELNESEHPVRQRFTLAHELGHLVVARVEQPYDSRPFLRCARNGSLERLCDAVGGRLLMPSRDFAEHMGAHGPSLAGLRRVARCFNVSLRAAAIRMVEYSGTHSAVLWAFGTRSGSSRKAFRVAWSATPPGIFIPQDDSCKAGCLIDDCSVEDRAKSGVMRLNLGSLRGEFRVEAMPLVGSAREPRDVLMIVDNKRIAPRYSAGTAVSQSGAVGAE